MMFSSSKMKKIVKNKLKTLKFYFPRLYFLYVMAIKGQKVREISPKPWIDAEAVNWLKQNLKAEMNVFEYGSGGSTLFMSALVKSIISLEHDPVFYVTLKDIIKKDRIKNCRLVFAPPHNRIPTDTLYASTDEHFKNMSFKKYVETIHEYPDNYFDFVFVDGRARNGCVVTALPKIKNGGYLLLDNSDRPEYKISLDVMSGNPSWVFANPAVRSDNYCETTIWQIKK